MKYNSNTHHRHSIRLKNYDYSRTGAYFITICTYDKKSLFGKIQNGKIILNKFGKIAHSEWLKSAEIRDEIELDLFVVMPNHIHGIVIIDRKSKLVGANGCSPLQTAGRSSQISPGDTPQTSTDFSSISSPNDMKQPKIIIGANGRSPLQSTDLSPPQNIHMSSKSISSFVSGYKSSVTKQINILQRTPKFPVWQRNYYDHVIRNNDDLSNTRDYIINNPLQWELDRENPENIKRNSYAQ